MHGGLFKRDDVKLDELKVIDRNRQPGDEGIYQYLVMDDMISFYDVHGLSRKLSTPRLEFGLEC